MVCVRFDANVVLPSGVCLLDMSKPNGGSALFAPVLAGHHGSVFAAMGVDYVFAGVLFAKIMVCVRFDANVVLPSGVCLLDMSKPNGGSALFAPVLAGHHGSVFAAMGSDGERCALLWIMKRESGTYLGRAARHRVCSHGVLPPFLSGFALPVGVDARPGKGSMSSWANNKHKQSPHLGRCSLNTKGSLLKKGVRGMEIQGNFVKFTGIGIYLEDKAIPLLASKWKGKIAEELVNSVEFFRDIVTGIPQLNFFENQGCVNFNVRQEDLDLLAARLQELGDMNVWKTLCQISFCNILYMLLFASMCYFTIPDYLIILAADIAQESNLSSSPATPVDTFPHGELARKAYLKRNLGQYQILKGIKRTESHSGEAQHIESESIAQGCTDL
ncbi:Chalcone--flavonone isomerase 2 [Artemisia annua]|uniref:Chalcone-flavonone isomerase family protein n=1 Tax=Artemisia annua TaxID=35608 RepID=A0A2U1PVK0_ARTAN|nr:Chalcone--flavonone isomerase 2 [Artemisia annua]